MTTISAFAPERQSSFDGSRSDQERRFFRRIIDRSDMSRNMQAVLHRLVNQWFHHRNVATWIHPGKEKLAKLTKLSERTIARALAAFRDLGFIKALKYAKGGRNSTRYEVDLLAIREALCVCTVTEVPGCLEQVYNVPQWDDEPVEKPVVTVGRSYKNRSDNAVTNENKPCQFGTRINKSYVRFFSGVTRIVERVERPFKIRPLHPSSYSNFDPQDYPDYPFSAGMENV